MIAQISHANQSFKVDLGKPIDISIAMKPDESCVRAWYLDPLKISPVRGEGFVGAVKEGGSVNFRNIEFNPHGHGTHTECLGHITEEVYSVNQHIKQFFFLAELISFEPNKQQNDSVISLEQYANARKHPLAEAIVLRTLPNNDEKKSRQYSSTNPPYIEWQVAKNMREEGIKHLLIDTPSVDREEDGGRLLAHHAFWNIPENPRFDCSITELIYVPNWVEDGLYLLNLGFASFENDASPSKPLLFEIKE